MLGASSCTECIHPCSRKGSATVTGPAHTCAVENLALGWCLPKHTDHHFQRGVEDGRHLHISRQTASHNQQVRSCLHLTRTGACKKHTAHDDGTHTTSGPLIGTIKANCSTSRRSCHQAFYWWTRITGNKHMGTHTYSSRLTINQPHCSHSALLACSKPSSSVPSNTKCSWQTHLCGDVQDVSHLG